MPEAVKTPHINLSYEHCDSAVIGELVDILHSKFKRVTITVINSCQEEALDNDEERVNVFETDWWKSLKPGDLLAGCRLKHQLTQKQLAEMTGMSYATISAYETGKRPLSQRAAIKLANAMNEKPERFFRHIAEEK